MFAFDLNWQPLQRERWSDGGFQTDPLFIPAPVLANFDCPVSELPIPRLGDQDGGFFARAWLTLYPDGADIALSCSEASTNQRQPADGPSLGPDYFSGLKPILSPHLPITGGWSRNYPGGGRKR